MIARLRQTALAVVINLSQFFLLLSFFVALQGATQFVSLLLQTLKLCFLALHLLVEACGLAFEFLEWLQQILHEVLLDLGSSVPRKPFKVLPGWVFVALPKYLEVHLVSLLRALDSVATDFIDGVPPLASFILLLNCLLLQRHLANGPDLLVSLHKIGELSLFLYPA